MKIFLKPMPRLEIPFGSVKTKHCNSVFRGAGEEGLSPSSVSSPTSEITRSCPPALCFLIRWLQAQIPQIFLPLSHTDFSEEKCLLMTSWQGKIKSIKLFGYWSTVAPHIWLMSSLLSSYQCLRLLQEILKENFALSKDKWCDSRYQHFPLSTLRKMTGILSQCYESTKVCSFYLVYFTFWLFKELSIKLKSPSWLVSFPWMRLPPYLQLNNNLQDA